MKAEHRASNSRKRKQSSARQQPADVAIDAIGPMDHDLAGADQPRFAMLLLAMLVAAATFIAFWPALQNQFVDWDDTDNFLRNPHYRGLTWENISWMFSTFHMGHYQPLTWLTLGVDSIIAERWYGDALDPRPYHFTNNVLHAINAALVFLVAVRLIGWRATETPQASLGTGRHRKFAVLIGAAAAALLFGVHPLRTESVAWATERRDLLSAFFLLLTVLAYLRAKQPGQQHPRIWMGVTLVLFICSLMSKVMGVTLPVALLVLDWYPLRRLGYWPTQWFDKRAIAVILEKLPLLLLSLIFSLIASILQGANQWLVTLEMHPLHARIVQSMYGLCFYLWKTLAPTNLLPLYEMPLPLDVSEPRFVIAGLAVLAAFIAIVVLYYTRRLSAIIAAATVYAVMLLPVLGLMQNGPQIVADRYSYMPCIGWAIVVGATLTMILRSRSAPAGIAATGVAAAAVVTLAALTWRQTFVWRDTASLWTYTAQKDPGSSRAQNGYGYVLLQQNRLDEAIEHLRRSIEINPANDKAHQNLWDALRRKQDVPGLIEALQAGTAVPSLELQAHAALGFEYLQLKQYGQAAEHYQAVLQRDAGNIPVRVNLAIALQESGRLDQAFEQYQQAISLDPDFFPARYNYGMGLQSAGRLSEAIEQYRAAARLNPEHAGVKARLQALDEPGS